jgi:hypothetical protein
MNNDRITSKNLTVQLKVQDYSTWRTGYDGREQGRTSAGITNGKVYRRRRGPE